MPRRGLVFGEGLAGCDANYDLTCTGTLGDEVSTSDSSLGFTAEDVWSALPGERSFTPTFRVEEIPATFSTVAVAVTRRDAPVFRAVVRGDGPAEEDNCTETTDVLVVPAHVDLVTDDGSVRGGVDLYVSARAADPTDAWVFETGDAAVEPVLTEVGLPEDWLPAIEAESGDIDPAEPYVSLGGSTSALAVYAGYRGPLASGEGNGGAHVLTFDLTPIPAP